MGTNHELSTGILEKLLTSPLEDVETLKTSSRITFQILSIAAVDNDRGHAPQPHAYRVILSDGKHFVQAMVSLKLGKLIHEGNVTKGTIAVLQEWSVDVILGKRLIVVESLKVLQLDVERIGEPESFDLAVGAEHEKVTESAEPVAGPSSVKMPNKVEAPIKAEAYTRKFCCRCTPDIRSGCLPIHLLNDYTPSDRITRVRVVMKNPIKTWSKGNGILATFIFSDGSNEIGAIAFNEVAELMTEKLQLNMAYHIRRANVTKPKKQWSSTVRNTFQISLLRYTDITECKHADDIPEDRVSYYITLAELQKKDGGTFCDVIAVVKYASEPYPIITRNSREKLLKRDLHLVDDSQTSTVWLSIWGKDAEAWNMKGHPVVTVHNAKIRTYRGRSLTTGGQFVMRINPNIPRARQLREWYDNMSNDASFTSNASSDEIVICGENDVQSFSRFLSQTLAEIQSAPLDRSNSGHVFHTSATIVQFKYYTYPICPACGSLKKLLEVIEPKGLKCEACGSTPEEPNYRYNIKMMVSDHTDQAWFHGWNELGVELFGVSAGDFEIANKKDGKESEAIRKRPHCNRFNFVCRAQLNRFNGKEAMQYTVLKIEPLNYADEAVAIRDSLMPKSSKTA